MGVQWEMIYLVQQCVPCICKKLIMHYWKQCFNVVWWYDIPSSIFLYKLKRKCGHWSKLWVLDIMTYMCVRMNIICEFLTNIWCMTFVWNFHRFLLLRVLEKLPQMIIRGVIQEKLVTRTMELILYQVVSWLKRVFLMLIQRKNW